MLITFRKNVGTGMTTQLETEDLKMHQGAYINGVVIPGSSSD